MRFRFAVWALLPFGTGCATLTQGPEALVHVSSAGAPAVVRLATGDTSRRLTPTVYVLPRSSRSVTLLVEGRDPVVLQPRLSRRFVWGNLVGAPYSWLFDWRVGSDRIRTYPGWVRLPDSPGPAILGWIDEPQARQERRGISGWIGVPEGNWFRLSPGDSEFGFLGLTAGLSYDDRPERSWTIHGGTMLDFIAPIPAPYEYFPVCDSSLTDEDQQVVTSMFGSYVAVERGWRVGRNWTLGGGAHFGWLRHQTVLACRNEPDRVARGFGPALSLERQLGQVWLVSLRYLPGVYREPIRGSRWVYGHLAFLEVGLGFGR